MEYNKLVAVTGMPGLYELLSSKADGGIVKSLQDGSSKFVSNRVHQFSHLESIEIYTTEDNVNMVEIFQGMATSKEKMPDAKASNEDIKKYFTKVYPAIDIERVYASDMKKMLKWFEILDEKKIDIKLTEQTEATEGEEEGAKPAAEKKTAAKKQAAPKAAAIKSGPAKKVTAPRKMA
jgi:hypothetical protein